MPELLGTDTEGEWVRFDGPPAHLGKRLSIDKVWHVLDTKDLLHAPHGVVGDVETRIPQRDVLVHYDARLERLDLLGVRDLLHLVGPLAAWRAAILATALCRDLQALHELNLPQMFLSPGRIGRLGEHIVLIPSLPGAMSPLSQELKRPEAGWLSYIAPEVLRTRGLAKNLLLRGDVYSLGRTLEVLCMTSAERVDARDAFELATRRVECTCPERLGDLSPPLWRLRTLITRMCSLLPDDRPGLDECIVELRAMVEQQSPELVLQRLGRSPDNAKRYLDDFRQAHDERVFGVTEKALHLMSADVFMIKDPPEYGRALIELDHAEGSEYAADVQLRVARVYLQHEGHPDHIACSAQAYMRAAALSGWAPDILEEAVTTLKGVLDPSAVLEYTNDIPLKERPNSILFLRAQILYEKGNLMQAWDNVSEAMAGVPFDPNLYGLAKRIAETIRRDHNPLKLMKWMYEHQYEAGTEAAIALVWYVNGNEAKAVELLGRLGQTDPSMRG